MRTAIYSPYLDTLGGGERYMMTIAEVLSSGNWVDVLLDSNLFLQDIGKLRKNLSERFGLNLSSVNFIEAPFGKDSNFLQRAIFLMKYDLLIVLTDGSIFYPTATKNILHIQSPIVGQPAKDWWGKIKLSGWDLIIYNSTFTKKNCIEYWNAKSKVVYPPVDTDRIKHLKKKKNILSVGRFFGYLKDKKHELLIDIFKKLYESQDIKDWSLHLVGSAGEGDRSYLEQLGKIAEDLPVKFYPNLEYEQLIKLYGESSIYWHAAGFGEEDPTRMEHFGISTVEAMAGGCVPVVIDKGGQKEIVENYKSGFLWNSLQDLEKFTLKLINDQNLRSNLSKNAILASDKFSKIRFGKEIQALLKE